MKRVSICILVCSGFLQFAVANTFSDADREAIRTIDGYIHTSHDAEHSLDYLVSVKDKNPDNQRVQAILGEVISHFRPDTRSDDETSDTSRSFQDSLEELASSLNKSHNYESTLSLDTLKLSDEDKKDEKSSDAQHDVEWIDVNYSDKSEPDQKFADPDYKESWEEVDYTNDAQEDKVNKVRSIQQQQSEVYWVEVDADEVIGSESPRLVTEFVYDEDRVEQARVSRVNELRRVRDLPLLTTDFRLRQTARDRSLSLRAKQEADHKRSADAPYYDYPVITQWFAERGVVFENINRATSTENIGRAGHTCSGDFPQKDCTTELINDLSRIYDYFASEESYNGVHRRTMIQPNFGVVGVSFAVDAANDKVYAVMHYGTRIVE